MTGQPYLTVSVDDGSVNDMRAAELLEKHGLKATFYIPATNWERPVLPAAQVRALSANFEIGGHTYGHVALHKLSPAQVRAELEGGKNWVEDVTGQPANSFCYPWGKFNSSVRQAVVLAGFTGARTLLFNRNELAADPFLTGVSTHACSHSPAIQIRHALLEGNFLGALNFIRVHHLERDWVRHFQHALDSVAAIGGAAHLYFHSWEIEAHDQWQKLDSLLAQLAQRTEFKRITNGELFTVAAAAASK